MYTTSMAPELTLDQVDLLDQDLFAEREPWDVFELLRREAPVYWHPGPEEGDGFWCVTRYDDLVYVLKNARLFSSEANGSAQIEWMEPDVLEARRNFMETDAPRHTAWRRQFARSFTPRAVADYSDFLRELTGQMLDDAIDRGEVDFVHDIAAVIPIRALGHMLGVPEEHLGRLVELGDRMIIDTDPEIAHVLAGSPEAEAFKYQPFGSEAAAELCALGRPLIAERQACPRDDVLSILANMEIDGRPLTPVELDNNFALFIVAGNETTRQGMALGLLQLIENPWAMDELRADPSLYPTAIDELLRLASPVWHFRRTATEDTEIGGVKIAKGERVVVWYAAANRDPEAFPEPDKLVLTRKRDEHASFGRGGPHFCIGAHLARLEITILVEELVKRVDKVELVAPPRRLRSNFTNGVKEMRVRFTRRAG
jgi:cytochrome P450